MSTHNMISWRNKKNIMRIPSLICSYDLTTCFHGDIQGKKNHFSGHHIYLKYSDILTPYHISKF